MGNKNQYLEIKLTWINDWINIRTGNSKEYDQVSVWVMPTIGFGGKEKAGLYGNMMNSTLDILSLM